VLHNNSAKGIVNQEEFVRQHLLDLLPLLVYDVSVPHFHYLPAPKILEK
jgi:hypothetical protein